MIKRGDVVRITNLEGYYKEGSIYREYWQDRIGRVLHTNSEGTLLLLGSPTGNAYFWTWRLTLVPEEEAIFYKMRLKMPD